MAYIILDDYEDDYIDTEIEFADGDAKLKAFFAKTRVGPNTREKASWVTGPALPPDVVPKKARITKGDAIYDWRTIRGGACLVSADFKGCVEQMEPGQHGFFPISVINLHGVAKPGPYFLFNVVGRIDSIIEAQSNLKALGRGDIDTWAYEPKGGGWKCALDASVIGERGCWTETRFGRRWFISDRLAALMRERGLRGFRYTDHCDEVSL